VVLLSLAALIHLALDHVEGLWVNDGFVVAFHIVLRNLAFVELGLLREVVDREGLLQEGIALVLLISKDALH
jgi:hypothetical protein